MLYSVHVFTSSSLFCVLFEGRDCGLLITVEFKNIRIILFKELGKNMASLFLFTKNTISQILFSAFYNDQIGFYDCSYWWKWFSFPCVTLAIQCSLYHFEIFTSRKYDSQIVFSFLFWKSFFRVRVNNIEPLFSILPLFFAW